MHSILIKIFFIPISLLIISFISCKEQKYKKTEFSKEDYSFKRMDTNFMDNSLSSQKIKYNSLSYKDILLGVGVIVRSISNETLKRRKISHIKIIDFIDEKYDSLSNLIYEKCISWTGATEYKYFYDKDNKPKYIISLSDTIKYLYDKNEKLVKCGQYSIIYYNNGFKKSVENAAEIEKYEYDTNGNLCHVNFDIKPGISYCGNRTSEWFGKYDANHRLIKSLGIGFPSSSIKTYYYSKEGDLIKTSSKAEFRKDSTVTDFIYEENTVIIKKIHEK